MSATDTGAVAAGGVTSVRYPGLLKIAIMVATVMQVLDMTIANVALPHMQAALGASRENISWVLTSYILASAIALPAVGWLSDRLGQRRLYLISVGGFTAASILCGLATNLESIVIYRILQGICGAFLVPLAQTVLLDTTPREKHGQAMAVFGMGVMVGPIMGPILGGVLTDHLSWRWVFFVNVPIGLLAFASLWFLLPDARRQARSLDIVGLGLLVTGLAALQLMLDRGQHLDWFNSIEIWTEAIVAAAALWMFGVHVMTARNPLYSTRLLFDRNLLAGTVLMAVVGFAIAAAMALMPLMLQGVFNYPVIDAGLLLAVRGIGVVGMMAIAGRLVSRVDSRWLIVTAFLILAFSFWEMSQWSLDVSWRIMAINGFIQGLGLGMMFVPITTMAFSTLPADLRTDGSGILNLSRAMGSSMGISVMVTLLDRGSVYSHSVLVTYLTPYSLWLPPRADAAFSEAGQAGLAMVDAEIARQATMIAFLDDYHVMMLVALCAIPFVLLIRKAGKTADGAPNHHAIME